MGSKHYLFYTTTLGLLAELGGGHRTTALRKAALDPVPSLCLGKDLDKKRGPKAPFLFIYLHTS